MISLHIVIFILFLHWFSDFVSQSDWEAKNKSTSAIALFSHTITYSLPWLFFGIPFAIITFLCHTLTDYYTSRLNSKLWAKGDVHNFFVSIGFDQFLHYIQLLLTYYFLHG